MSTVSEETIKARIETMMAYNSIPNEHDRIAQMICDITAMRLNLKAKNEQLKGLKEKLRWIPIGESDPKFDPETNGAIEAKDLDGYLIPYLDDCENMSFHNLFVASGITHWRFIPELEDGE